MDNAVFHFCPYWNFPRLTNRSAILSCHHLPISLRTFLSWVCSYVVRQRMRLAADTSHCCRWGYFFEKLSGGIDPTRVLGSYMLKESSSCPPWQLTKSGSPTLAMAPEAALTSCFLTLTAANSPSWRLR